MAPRLPGDLPGTRCHAGDPLCWHGMRASWFSGRQYKRGVPDLEGAQQPFLSTFSTPACVHVSIHWPLSTLSHLPGASGVSAATPAQEKSIMAFVGPLVLGAPTVGPTLRAKAGSFGGRPVSARPLRPAAPPLPRAPTSMKLSPGFLIKNDTIWPLQISLNQVSPLYYGVVKPGETFERTTGAVWFTIRATILFDEEDAITLWDAILPVASIVGTVILTAATAGAAAYAAGPAIAAAGGATGAVAGGVTGLSTASLAATSLAAQGLVGAGFSAGAALTVSGVVIGGTGAAATATTTAALTDIFSDEAVSVSGAGYYAGPPWPFRNDLPTYRITGGPTYSQGPMVNGKPTVEMSKAPMRIES